MGYKANPDGFSPKFTGQERDAETGLDYLHARYYSAPQGTFLSGDPGNAGASLGDPRTWNGYGYVGGDPLALTDPTGESWWSNLLGVLAGIGTFIGTGFDALEGVQVGLGVADTVDSAAHGQFPAAGLFELLGAAASLGDADAGGAIGTGGGYGGGSAGPFIFNYGTYWHVYFTVGAGGGLFTALGVAAVDFWHNTQDTDAAHANWHAMGGTVGAKYQTCQEAYAGSVQQLGDATQKALRGDQSAKELAIHTIQDSYALGHQYSSWHGAVPSAEHLQGDWEPSLGEQAAVIGQTRRYLDALRHPSVMDSPGSYLAPGSVCRMP